MTSSGLRGLFGSCVSDRSSTLEHGQQHLAITNAPQPRSASTPNKKQPASPKPLNKVKFGVPLSESVRDDCLPVPLVDMLVYIAQEGVTTTDLFRRSGNPTDLKIITKRLTEGKPIQFNNYNFYTLASVIKKFLLKIPGGVLGPKVERKLLDVLLLDNRMQQYDTIHSIISSLAPANQQLLALLFGTWFRIVNHSEYNTMSSEAMAKSVAGSLFHTCNDNPLKVETAVKVLQILIDDFGVANMFGRKNIQYFADKTRTGIRVREKFCYEFQHPMDGSTQLSPQHEDSVDHSEGRSDQQLQDIALLLQKEATHRGFHIQRDAITEEEFYGGRNSSRRATEESNCEDLGVSSSTPPSPQSLQPQYHDSTCDSSADYNPHKKLTHVSSLSAPDVNKVFPPTPPTRTNTPHARSVSPPSTVVDKNESKCVDTTNARCEQVTVECVAPATPESAVPPLVSPVADVLLQANQVRPPSQKHPNPDNTPHPSSKTSPKSSTSTEDPEPSSSSLEQIEVCSTISLSETKTLHNSSLLPAPKPKSFHKRLPRISLLAPFRRMFSPRSSPDLTDVEKPVRRRQKKGRKAWRKSFPGLGKSEAKVSEEHWRHSVPVLETGSGSGAEGSSHHGSPVVLSHSFDILPSDSTGDVQVLSTTKTTVPASKETAQKPPTIEIHLETNTSPPEKLRDVLQTTDKASSEESENDSETSASRPRYLRVWRKSLSEACSTDVGMKTVPEDPVSDGEQQTLGVESVRDKRYRFASESRDDALLDGYDEEETLHADEVAEQQQIEGEHQGQIFVDRMKYRLSEVDEDKYAEYLLKEKQKGDGKKALSDETDNTGKAELSENVKTDAPESVKGRNISSNKTDENDSCQNNEDARFENADTAEIIDGPKYEDEDIDEEDAEVPVAKPRSGFSKWLSASSKYTYNPARGVYRHDDGADEGVLVEPLPPEPPSITGAIASKLGTVKDKVVNDVIPAIPALSGINLDKLRKEKETKPVRDRVHPIDDGPQAPLYYPPSLSSMPTVPSLSSSLQSLKGSEDDEESDKVPEHLVRPHRPKSLVAKWWNSSKPSKYTYHPTEGVLKHDLENLYAMFEHDKRSRGSIGEWMNTMSCITMDSDSSGIISPDIAENPVLGAPPIVVFPTEEQDSVASSSSDHTDSHVPVLILPARIDKTPAPINQPVVLYPMPSDTKPVPAVTRESAAAPLPPSIKQPIIIYPTKPPEEVLKEVNPPTSDDHKAHEEMREKVTEVVGPEAQPVILYSPPMTERRMKPTSPTASAIAQPLLLATPPHSPLVAGGAVGSNTLPRTVPRKLYTNPSSTLPRTLRDAPIQPEMTGPVGSRMPTVQLRHRHNADDVPRPSILFGLECSHPYDSVPNVPYQLANLIPIQQQQIRKLRKTLSSPSPHDSHEPPKDQDSYPSLPKNWRLSLPPENQVVSDVIMRKKDGQDNPSLPKNWRMSLPCPPPPDAISLPRWRMWQTPPSPLSEHPPLPTTTTNPWAQVGRHWQAAPTQQQEQEEHSIEGYSPTTELSPAKRFCLSTSLSRFDNVRRQQMLRMKKRTNWFLSPNQSAGLDSSRGSDSLLGSAEGKSSDAAMSSDALLSSDGCLSDVSRVVGSGSGHELDSTTNTTSSLLLTTPAHHHPHHHHAHRGGSRGPSPQPSPQPPFAPADVVNGNHHHHHHPQQRTSTPAKRWGPGGTVIVRSRSPSPSSTVSSSTTATMHNTTGNNPSTGAVATTNTNATMSPAPSESTTTSTQGSNSVVSERDVRYFMVDNYYGGNVSNNGGGHSGADNHGSNNYQPTSGLGGGGS